MYRPLEVPEEVHMTSEKPQAVAEADVDAEAKALLSQMNVSPQSNLIAVLQEVQGKLGYLPASALSEMSLRMRIPLSSIYGVVSFYAQFYTEPHGRHTVRCCNGTACHVKGARRVLDAVKAALGIDEGQTTDDMMFYLETVACLGTCFLAPAMMIDNQYYGMLNSRRVKEILNSFRETE